MEHFLHKLLDLPPVDRQFALLSSGAGLYFAADETLRFQVQTSASNVAVTLSGIMWTVQKGYTTFERTARPDGDRSVTSVDMRMGESLLIDVTVSMTGSTSLGRATYARVTKIRGQDSVPMTLQSLLAGYVSPRESLTYPPVFFEPQFSGRGNIRSITGTDPAAGVEISETVPTNTMWRVIAITFDLVTDATVANRIVRVEMDDGTNVHVIAAAPNTQAASLTLRYTAADGGQSLTTSGNRVGITLPGGVFLRESSRIRTNTGNLQAGDNFTAPQLLVEEWIVD